MTRNDVQTVTFPVLVLAENIDHSDGWGTFLNGEQFDESDDASLLVHLVTKDDMKKWLRDEFDKKDSALFLGVGQLKSAYDHRDDFGLHRAYEKLRQYAADLAPPEDFDLEFKSRDGKRRATVRFKPKWSATRWNYSRLMTEIFETVRLVMWFSESGKRFIPAFFCRDKKTAVYAMILTGRMRLCPKCDALFIPSAGNVDYCCPAHREAHRVARSRWRAKQKIEGIKKKRN